MVQGWTRMERAVGGRTKPWEESAGRPRAPTGLVSGVGSRGGLGEEDAVFVTVGSDQQLARFRETGEAKPGTWPPGQRVTADAVRTILKRLAEKAGVDPKLATRTDCGTTSACRRPWLAYRPPR